MQIVIDISKYVYDTIVASDGYIQDCDNEKVGMAVKDGIPLSKVRAEVIDKIRAEIEQLTYYWCEVNPKSVIDDVLEILDKYKMESEVSNETDN